MNVSREFCNSGAMVAQFAIAINCGFPQGRKLYWQRRVRRPWLAAQQCCRQNEMSCLD
jgi:ATP-dependent helicase YprA (DUF1998 family)